MKKPVRKRRYATGGMIKDRPDDSSDFTTRLSRSRPGKENADPGMQEYTGTYPGPRDVSGMAKGGKVRRTVRKKGR